MNQEPIAPQGIVQPGAGDTAVSEAAPNVPDYKEIMNQMLGQLNKRKGVLLKRVTLSLAPFLFGFILISMSGISDEGGKEVDITVIPSFQQAMVITGILFFVILGPIWYKIINRIFKIERMLWIDSFFDKVEVTNAQSWSIAKKLFWPSFWFDVVLFFRYYALALAVMLIVMIAGMATSFSGTESYRGWIFIASLFLPPIALGFYIFFTEIKLRYVWFIFIDLYGTPDFAHRNILKQMKTLNRLLKQEDFKKLLVTTIGLDAAGAAVNAGIGAATYAIGSFGGVTKTAAQAAGIVATNMAEVSKDYAKQVSYYMFYRLARQEMFGADDKGSVSLYANITKK